MVEAAIDLNRSLKEANLGKYKQVLLEHEDGIMKAMSHNETKKQKEINVNLTGLKWDMQGQKHRVGSLTLISRG